MHPSAPEVTARAVELEAHEALREAIRRCAVAQYDRRVEEDPDDTDPEVREKLERTAVLVDYVVVACFDDLGSDRTVTSIIRTDGKCAAYRVFGLLEEAALDMGR